MNSLAVQTASVNWATPIDVEFLPPVTDISELVSPYMLGVLDAESGELCLPELYFTQKGQQREFAEGYESVVGRTLLSDQVMGRQRQLTQAEIDAETLDYAEDILDRAYHASGNW